MEPNSRKRNVYIIFAALMLIILIAIIYVSNSNTPFAFFSQDEGDELGGIFSLANWGTEANVTLISPADDSTSSGPIVEFNSSAIITGGDGLINTTLYTNETGTWEARNTSAIPLNATGLLSWWELEELSGLVLDSAFLNGNYTGINNGATTGATGIIGNAYDFEASENDWVNVSDAGALSFDSRVQNYSVSGWFQLESLGTRKTIIMDRNENLDAIPSAYSCYVETDNQLDCDTYDGTSITVNGNATLTTGQWYHFVFLRNTAAVVNGEFQLWLNGTLIGANTNDHNDNTKNTQGTSIGRQAASTPINYFDGLIDELSVWNIALNSTQIIDLYNSGAADRAYITTYNSSIQRTITSGIVWNQEYCDSEGDCGFAGNNFTLNTDQEAPLIYLDAPKGILDFGALNYNETLNVSFGDNSGELESCIYEFYGANFSIAGCLNNTYNQTNLTLQQPPFNITLYVNDSLGNSNSSFSNWYYKIFELNQSYEPTVTEGALANYSAYTILNSTYTISQVNLTYPNGSKIGSVSTQGIYTILNVENFIVPEVSADINNTFNLSVLLSTGEHINLTNQIQQVLEIGLDNCTTFTNEILNISIVDEENQNLLGNTSLEVAINLLTADRSQVVVSLADEFDDQNPVAICLEEEIPAEVEYSLDAILKYSADAHAIEYYHLIGRELTNETQVLNLTLYDLNSTDSTEFQITFTGEDFLPEENVLIFVDRQYVSENVFKTVELPRTDSNGQTVAHLVRNDVIYNLIAVKDGVTLATFENIIAFCEDFTIGNCVIALNALSNQTSFFDYDGEVGITFDGPPSYNATTNDVSFSFVSTSGEPVTVLLQVERKDIFGNVSICSNTLTSTSGVVTCDIGQNLTETNLYATISVNGISWLESVTNIDETTLGVSGVILFFILSLVMILINLESKTLVLLSLVVSYGASISLGLILGGLVGLGSTGILLIVLTVIGLWKLNRRKI